MTKFTDAPCPTCGSPRKVVDGAWLRARRQRAGVTLREMGRRIGVSAVYLSDIERGSRRCTTRILNDYERLID